MLNLHKSLKSLEWLGFSAVYISEAFILSNIPLPVV